MNEVILKIGKVAIKLRNEWQERPERPYMKLDAVSKDGSSYVSLLDNNTAVPTDASKWMVLAKKGDKGDKVTLEDFTSDELAELQRPATEAARSLSALGKKLECMIEKSEEAIDNIGSFEERLVTLEDEVFPYSLTVTGTGLFEKGTSQTIILEWTLKKGDNSVVPETSQVNGIPVTGNTKTFEGVTKDTEYTVSVTYSGKTFSRTSKAEFISPIYMGFSSQEYSQSLDITSLGKLSVRRSPAGSYSVQNTATGNYLWICVPSGMSITKVTSSGFEVPMYQVQEGSTQTDSYNCYRSFSPINEGTMNITIQ